MIHEVLSDVYLNKLIYIVYKGQFLLRLYFNVTWNNSKLYLRWPSITLRNRGIRLCIEDAFVAAFGDSNLTPPLRNTHGHGSLAIESRQTHRKLFQNKFLLHLDQLGQGLLQQHENESIDLFLGTMPRRNTRITVWHICMEHNE